MLVWLKRMLLVGGALLGISVAQVLYVRFFSPWPTQTMLARKVDAWQTGKATQIHRTWVPLESIAPDLQRAVLLGEDAFFYQHHGFDFEQIKKAWAHNQKGKKIRGASTISQQTARNVFLWQGRSWVRKGLEAYYTVLLELLLPKQRILELYLNVAEWGDMVFGAEAAAQKYFHKPALRLARGEAAALSASLPNPRKFPATGGSRFVQRRKAIILRRFDEAIPGEPSVDKDED